jgi:hypothetical protein
MVRKLSEKFGSGPGVYCRREAGRIQQFAGWQVPLPRACAPEALRRDHHGDCQVHAKSRARMLLGLLDAS